MNKSDLKNFAINARLALLQRVADRAALYGIDEEKCQSRAIVPSSAFHMLDGSVLSAQEVGQRNALIARISKIGYRQTMEEAAYTWFNRLIAIRYMQQHSLLPVSMRVLPEAPGALPQILREAQDVSLPGVEPDQVLAMLDANRTDALYKYLLIALCNALGGWLPGMFQQITSVAELLFPAALLKADSVLGEMARLGDDCWNEIQVIGWLYQYYNTQLKDETFELLKKNIKITKERIGAATQLFTPEWIVRYMVENSLGRLWLEGHPNETLRMKWRYYMDEAPQEPAVAARLAQLRAPYAALQPDQLTVLDPCMGSGHILVYAFDVLMDIYRSVGYTDRDAVQSIVQNNLYGLDIDDRAAQLAYFAVMMKACEYDRRFLRRGVQPHVCAIAESVPLAELSPFGAEKALAQTLLDTFRDAKEYGSILHVPLSLADIRRLADRTAALQSGQHDTLLSMADNAQAAAAVQPLLLQAQILARQYDAVITNPPYMGASGMNDKLSKFVKDNYPDAKSDLFACFIERGNEWVHPNAISCMVTMQSWMFLSSFEKMRGRILKEKNIVCLMHMENMVMGIAFGTAVTAMRNAHIPAYKGTYNQVKLCDIENEIPKDFPVQGNRFAQVSSDNFSKIPGAPVAYWVSEKYFSILSGTTACNYAKFCKGMDTGENDRFLRLWHEIDRDKTYYPNKWIPYNKGGSYRKWYGNREYVLNWENNGFEIRNYSGSNIRNERMYLKAGLTWSTTSSGPISIRYCDGGFIFDSQGCMAFTSKETYLFYLLGAMNSCVYQSFMQIITPTISYNPGPVSRGAIIIDEKRAQMVIHIVNECIVLSKYDWDFLETSWDFERHPLI
ncbi:MAG: BREX-1 system adenine-specific DNA-methyltransferase PglX [Clostridiales bacterium]|nr:BREX-1 system adenine-specific DNA-methyltransferase PglX [Clostridiales bacterium]MDY5468968.1 BREX-1 system adenine-specific DNA-methyltransferase PglX [Eubacteriales bacterium]